MFDRLLRLSDLEDLKKIESQKILLVGIGGVGGYTLEALVRSGFRDITIIDGDTIDVSNINRQIIATSKNITKLKGEEAKIRCLEINPNVNIKTINTFLTSENFSKYVKEKYDYIIDACDDIKMKIELIKYALDNDIKIITALGTGRKLNPTKLEITSLNKTYNDPLAKKLRYELKKRNIALNIPVVFSREEAIDTGSIIGSAIFVPASAGLLLANYVFCDVTKKN